MKPAGTLMRVLWLYAVLLVCVGCGAGAARHDVIAIRPSHLRPVAATSMAGRPIDPTAFARGACMAFVPTSPSRHLTVFLDAGHGGRDPGAIRSTTSGPLVLEGRQAPPAE